MPIMQLQSTTSARAERIDFLMRAIILVVATIALSMIFLIFIFTFKEAKDVFFDAETRHEVLPTLFSTNWQPISDSPKYGIIPLLIGTLKTTLIAMVIAVPIGVLAAIYTSCFSPIWFKELIKPVVELLAGFPSVVIGFFCALCVSRIFAKPYGCRVSLERLGGWCCHVSDCNSYYFYDFGRCPLSSA